MPSSLCMTVVEIYCTIISISNISRTGYRLYSASLLCILTTLTNCGYITAAVNYLTGSSGDE